MKDSYYFPHDYHARHDPKNEKARMEFGPIADGIYWNLVEMLYEQKGYLRVDDIPHFAKLMNTNPEIICKIVRDTQLFCVKKDLFFSKSVIRRLRIINAKRRNARISGRKGGLANAKQTLSKRLAIKERKVKKRNSSDVDFLTQLKKNPAYSHININNELSKMDAWLLTHPDRKKTQRFVVNWLNRIDKPVVTPKRQEKPIKQEKIDPVQRAEVAKLINETVKEMKDRNK